MRWANTLENMNLSETFLYAQTAARTAEKYRYVELALSNALFKSEQQDKYSNEQIKKDC